MLTFELRKLVFVKVKSSITRYYIQLLVQVRASALMI